MSEYLHYLRKHYQKSISAEEEYAKLDWEDNYSHLKRFEILLSHINLTNKSLLDVGCGVGSLLRYLESHRVPCQYKGIDILPEMIDIAKTLSPHGTFLQGNPFETPIFKEGEFDVVFASGIFNLCPKNSSFTLYNGVKHMLVWAREYVVFNALHERSPHKELTYCYYNPDEVVVFLEKISPKFEIQLIDDYLINDFTIIIRTNI